MAPKLSLTNRENWEGSRCLAGVPSWLKRPRKASLLLQAPHTFLVVSMDLECRFTIIAQLQVGRLYRQHMHGLDAAVQTPFTGLPDH